MTTSERGMTLVEVTVASIVFALIMLAVVTAMRTFGQAYDRLQEVTNVTTQRREVDRFLRYALEDALAEPGYFDGSSSEVEWVAPIDRAGSAGGLQHLKLLHDRGSLVLQFAPFDRFGEPGRDPQWDADVAPVALLDELDRIRVSYRSSPEEEWSDSTESDDSGGVVFPWAVRLEIFTNNQAWPPLIVALQQYPLGQ